VTGSEPGGNVSKDAPADERLDEIAAELIGRGFAREYSR